MSTLSWSSRATLPAVVSRACVTSCIVLLAAAVVAAAEGDGLKFTVDQDAFEDVGKEARREVIPKEVDREAASKQDRPEASANAPSATAAIGPRVPLLRKWDINGDGRIDEGEAEVARARMRRERREMQREAGNDPLTGLPRRDKDQAADGAGEATSRRVNEDETAELPADTDSDDDDTSPWLPGTRTPRLAMPVPIPQPPVVGLPQGIPRASIYTRPPEATQPPSGPAASGVRPSARGQVGALTGPQSGSPAGLGSRAGWTSRWTQPLTGGARAGAPPAAAGYGAASPKRDLNAGRHREDLPSLQGLTPRIDVSGGLLPTVRQPRQTIAPPVAPVVRPPRLTAEEIGGF